MYEIRPETIKSFIEDENIKLPRFQRKQTWDDKKNFQLCISIFKEFPIGVSILNIDTTNGETNRWLLDGRQRRNALSKFYSDPENAYVWAKKFIGIKPKDQLYDIEDKYWNKINEYLEADEDYEDVDETLSTNDTSEDTVENFTSEDELEYSSEKRGLELLLHIILLTHNKSSKFSGFTKPFDFMDEIKKLSYIDVSSSGKRVLSSKKLKTFIGEYKNYCINEGSIDYKKEKNFCEFLKYRYEPNDAKFAKIKVKVEKSWKSIIERVEILDKINTIYTESKVGLIEVKNLKSVDSQKIFNIINSEGTKLSAVEVLSAKPSWNLRISNPTKKQQDSTDELYRRINVEYNNTVKWDLPATLVSRLNDSDLLFKKFKKLPNELSKEITFRFKLLAGIYEGGVKKDNIDALGKNKEINWEVEYEDLIADINMATKLMMQSEYFKYLNSWDFSVMKYLSDAVAVNFILLIFMDWTRKGKPIGNDMKAKKFQKNAFILMDMMIYEFATTRWRGASDAKIANNISAFNNQEDLLPHVSEKKWEEIINEILNDNTIEGNPLTQNLMQPILFHFYSIKKIMGPDSDCTIEVDHIIPQSIFESSALGNSKVIMHNIYNLALLPKNENVKKGDKLLNTINDQWLMDQIEKYAFIEEKDYRRFSDLENLKHLKKLRGAIFLEAFTTKRNKILNQ